MEAVRRIIDPDNTFTIVEDVTIARMKAMERDQQAARLWRYAKVSLLMAFAWLLGFLALLTQTFQLMLVFIVLNAMQVSSVVTAHFMSY